MKSAFEWVYKWESESGYDSMTEFIADVQSESFHAGELSGLADAQEIVRSHAAEFNVTLADEIEKRCESLEKK